MLSRLISDAWTVIFGTIGLILVYCALFIDETEERKLHNRLEELWVTIDDLGKEAMSHQAAFLRQVSALAEHGLAKLFGPKLLSFKSVASCLCFSLASTAWAFLLLSSLERTFSPPYGAIPIAYLISAVFWSVCGVSRRLRYAAYALIPVFLLYYIRIGVPRPSGELHTISGLEVFQYLAPILASVLCDIGFVMLTRWSLRRSSRLSSLPGLVSFALLNVMLGVVLVGGLFFPLLLRHRLKSVSDFVTAHSTLWSYVMTISATNLLAAAFALLALILMLSALLHRLIWPAISRPIYAAHRFGLFKQHKLLAILGLTFLLMAYPANPLLKWLEKLVH
jgi:hypothetical protein